MPKYFKTSAAVGSRRQSSAVVGSRRQSSAAVGRKVVVEIETNWTINYRQIQLDLTYVESWQHFPGATTFNTTTFSITTLGIVR